MIEFSRSSRQIFLLVGMTLICIIPGLLLKTDFWVEDEARYAEVVREMIVDGNWLVPHLNGFIYPDKPPLYFWLASGISILLGSISPLSFLIINCLCAMALVILTFYFGKYLFDSQTGFWSGLVLLSSLLFLISFHIARMDILFTFLIVLAFYFFYRGYLEQKYRFYYGYYLASALAVLCKGPFGLILSFFPIVIFLILKSQKRQVMKFVLSKGTLLFGILVFGWLFLVYINGYDDLINNIFSKQILARTVNSFAQNRPFFYYLIISPLVFLPWFPFILRFIRMKKKQWTQESYLFLALWFVCGFTIISVVSCKIFIYLLPLLPPVALFLGRHLSNCKKKFFFTYFAIATIGVFVLFNLFFHGVINNRFSPKLMGEKIKYFSEAGFKIATSHVTRGILNFYAGQKILEINRKEMKDFLTLQTENMLIVKGKDYQKIKGSLGDQIKSKGRFRLNNETYYFIINQRGLKK
jgi:4-amino-4-deoxy-L-arabinose transferase-like glycosyltransferase